MEMAMKLKGKISLVTGADRGIGRGIVEVFADEGADVAVNYIEEPEKGEAVAEWVRERGGRSIIVKGDVSRRADVEAMLDKESKDPGPLDSLVTTPRINTHLPSL